MQRPRGRNKTGLLQDWEERPARLNVQAGGSRQWQAQGSCRLREEFAFCSKCCVMAEISSKGMTRLIYLFKSFRWQGAEKGRQRVIKRREGVDGDGLMVARRKAGAWLGQCL